MDWQQHFKSRSRETSRFGAAILQADDISAINRYFDRTRAKTKGASKIKDEWIVYHDRLSWYDKNFDTATYDKVRNYKRRFELANAVTSQELKAVQSSHERGLTTEEMQGGTRRVLSTGLYEEPSFAVPVATQVAVGAVAFTGFAAYIAYKLYFPSFLR